MLNMVIFEKKSCQEKKFALRACAVRLALLVYMYIHPLGVYNPTDQQVSTQEQKNCSWYGPV